MDFAQPDALIYLWTLPLVAFLLMTGFLRRQQRLRRFVHPLNTQRLAPRYSMGRAVLKTSLAVVACGCLVVALARPRWGYEWQEVKRKGVDIMVALDVSQSMQAEDIKPNRLDRARREIIDLIRMLKGDRIGLIAFAGVGFVQCPLTTDYKAVQMFLNHLNPDLIPIPGTSLADAINLGTKSLTTGSEASSAGKALILITDGEDQDSRPIAQANLAKEQGIKIFTIGMGQEGGAPIPLKEGGFKKDRQGNLIVTKLADGTLKEIAQQTGGTYVRSTTGDFDLKRIYEEGIKGGGLAEGEIKASRQKLWYERGYLFAAAALVFLLASYLVSDTVVPQPKKP